MDVARPLFNLLGRRGGGETDQLAALSRPRFVTLQLVTLLTALLTCLTVMGLALMKNTELQHLLLNWGTAADCILNHNQTDLKLTKEDPDSRAEVFDWAKFLQVLLQLGRQCSSTDQSTEFASDKD